MATLEDCAPSYSVVKNQGDKFNQERKNLKDSPHQERVTSVTSQEIINKIQEMLLKDWHL